MNSRLASSDGLHFEMKKALEKVTHILDPRTFFSCPPFATSKANEAAEVLGKALVGHVCDEIVEKPDEILKLRQEAKSGEPNGKPFIGTIDDIQSQKVHVRRLMYGGKILTPAAIPSPLHYTDGDPIPELSVEFTQPIIIPLNTTSGILSEAQTLQLINEPDAFHKQYNAGTHWLLCAILPKNYKNNNSQHETIILLDSMNPERPVPEAFINMLKKGMVIKIGKLTHIIPKIFPNLEVINSKSMGYKRQQLVGTQECGWWTAYNAEMLVQTGSVSELVKEIRKIKMIGSDGAPVEDLGLLKRYPHITEENPSNPKAQDQPVTTYASLCDTVNDMPSLILAVQKYDGFISVFGEERTKKIIRNIQDVKEILRACGNFEKLKPLFGMPHIQALIVSSFDLFLILTAIKNAEDCRVCILSLGQEKYNYITKGTSTSGMAKHISELCGFTCTPEFLKNIFAATKPERISVVKTNATTSPSLTAHRESIVISGDPSALRKKTAENPTPLNLNFFPPAPSSSDTVIAYKTTLAGTSFFVPSQHLIFTIDYAMFVPKNTAVPPHSSCVHISRDLVNQMVKKVKLSEELSQITEALKLNPEYKKLMGAEKSAERPLEKRLSIYD